MSFSMLLGRSRLLVARFPAGQQQLAQCSLTPRGRVAALRSTTGRKSVASQDTWSPKRLLRLLASPVASMRLDSFLQQYAYCARKDARQFCRFNDVEVPDGAGGLARVVTGQKKLDPTKILVNGDATPYAGLQLHIVMHKPRGFVCSRAEGEGKTVHELLPKSFGYRDPALSTIGRLDKGASGLLLLTQSGLLNARLTSPARKCGKTYVVSSDRPLRGDEAASFAGGHLTLVDGHVCAPAVLTPHRSLPNVCQVTLFEGRFHQLRRMFAALGHTVTGIHRIGFGGLRLSDTGLREGEWRLMTPREVERVLYASAKQERWRQERVRGAGEPKRLVKLQPWSGSTESDDEEEEEAEEEAAASAPS